MDLHGIKSSSTVSAARVSSKQQGNELGGVGTKVANKQQNILFSIFKTMISFGTSKSSNKLNSAIMSKINNHNLLQRFTTSNEMTAQDLQSISITDASQYKKGREKVTVNGQKYTKHPITITVNGKQKEAVILKKTGHGGRQRRFDEYGNAKKGTGALGAGSFKFVQEAVLMYEGDNGDIVSQKFALTAQDSKAKEDINVQQLLDDNKALSKVCIGSKFMSVKARRHAGPSDAKNKTWFEKNKTLGLAVKVEEAFDLAISKETSQEEKENFKNGVLRLVATLANEDAAHSDIKIKNLDRHGNSIDHGSLVKKKDGDDWDWYGSIHTPGKVSFYQWIHSDEFGTFEGKQRQDAFAAAVSIYEVYTGKNLINQDDKYRLEEGSSSNQLRNMIMTTRERIESLNDVEPELKQLLLDMTGTNTANKSKYFGGDNLYGKDLQARLKTLGIEPENHE
ncbi:MAG: hypothetical protein ACON35_03045 [Candidatus Marinamargulisbacteria bacterium]